MDQGPNSMAPLGEKPSEVTTITILILISGISNIIASLIWTFAIVFGTLGIGLLCTPITILPGVLGIFEVIQAANLLSERPKPVKNFQTIAILEICAILSFNVISLVTGILGLVFNNNPRVRGYFNQLG